jgi:hypothetical protein
MSLSNSASFIEPTASSSDADEIDSLPSSSTSSSGDDDDQYVSDAEREWRESLQQLELLLTMIVVPYVGKYFGRKCAYWGECIPSILCGIIRAVDMETVQYYIKVLDR